MGAERITNREYQRKLKKEKAKLARVEASFAGRVKKILGEIFK